MLLQAPHRVKAFVWYWCKAGVAVRVILAALIIGVLLVRGRRTLANLGGMVADRCRHTSNISRFLQRHADDVVECYNRAFHRALNRGVNIARRRGTKQWVLALDTTFQRKHSRTMPNLIKFKEKSKGVPAYNHAFVIGILIGPGGVRIPMPVQDFLTKDFVREINKERKAKREAVIVHRTQIDLAVAMIRDARALLPRDMKLWVVADNFFEGPKLDAACDPEQGAYYASPLDTGRVVIDPESEPPKRMKVRAFEKSLPADEFKRVAIVEGKEPFWFLRRRENNEAKRKRGRPRERVYQVAKRDLELNGLGKRTVFFSWKQRRFRNDSKRAKAHLKMLVTNHPNATANEVVYCYYLRWQVELFSGSSKANSAWGITK